MDIQTTKLELLKTILSIENGDLIQKVAEFIQNKKVNFYSTTSFKL
mgnify:CR=1 FL=1